MPVTIGHVYIIDTREFLASGEPVHKAGATGQTHAHERLKQYPKGSQMVLSMRVRDPFAVEARLQAALVACSELKQRTDFGKEYFEGPLAAVSNIFFNIAGPEMVGVGEGVQAPIVPEAKPRRTMEDLMFEFARTNMAFMVTKDDIVNGPRDLTLDQVFDRFVAEMPSELRKRGQRQPMKTKFRKLIDQMGTCYVPEMDFFFGAAWAKDMWRRSPLTWPGRRAELLELWHRNFFIDDPTTINPSSIP